MKNASRSILLLFQWFVISWSAAMPAPAQTDAGELLYAPFWYLDGETSARLEIASNATEPRDLTPVLLLDGVRPLAFDPIHLPAGGTVSLALEDLLEPHLGNPGPGAGGRWGDGSRPGSLWGAARLEGSSVEAVYAWIVTENRQRGLSLNSMFAPPARSAPSLVSTWWRATPHTEVLFVLQNTSSRSLTVSASVVVDGGRPEGRSFRLPSAAARVVGLRELLRAGGSDIELPDVGAVRFQVRDGSSSLQGTTLLVDEVTGFSSPLHMQDPSSRRGNEIQMPAVILGQGDPDLGFPPSTFFSPRLLLANLSARPALVTLTLRSRTEWQEGELDGEPVQTIGEPLALEIPLAVLAAHESRALDLLQLRDSVEGSVLGDGFVALELTHDGAPSDILAEVITVDDTLRFSFYDPFVDAARAFLAQTAVSFDISADRNKLFAVKNSSGALASFGLDVHYEEAGEQKTYEGAGLLPAHGLTVVDLKELRDGAIPDRYGQLLPPDLTSGHVRISAAAPGIIAGDYAFDTAGSMASCLDPCECNSFPIGSNCFHPPSSPSRDVDQCGNTPPPPPLATDQFERTYEYYVDNSNNPDPNCFYKVCPGQSFLSACPADFTLPLVIMGTTPGCWGGAEQPYTITVFSGGVVTCESNGNHTFLLVPCM